jgi:hypothetical protein
MHCLGVLHCLVPGSFGNLSKHMGSRMALLIRPMLAAPATEAPKAGRLYRPFGPRGGLEAALKSEREAILIGVWGNAFEPFGSDRFKNDVTACDWRGLAKRQFKREILARRADP